MRADGWIGIPLYDTSVLVQDIAALLGLIVEGEGSREIQGAAPLESAGPLDLSFVGGKKAFDAAKVSRAGCLIVPEPYEGNAAQTLIRSPQPRAAFAAALMHLYPRRKPSSGVHPTAVIGAGASVGKDCSVGPYVAVGDGSSIGDGSVIEAGCSIGRNVQLGVSSWLHPRVTLYDDVSIGARAILHSGCVIGADGFGFALVQDRYRKFPQVGRVEIGDDVEIGANACVDRAALGVTSIGDGVKLDNMVHIGHNCRIGKHVVIAAQTGLSGGVVIEDYAVIGGQVGIGDKARVESRAVLGSGSGVLTSKIIRSGQTVWGTPARPLRQYLEQLASISKIPALREEVAELKKRLK